MKAKDELKRMGRYGAEQLGELTSGLPGQEQCIQHIAVIINAAEKYRRIFEQRSSAVVAR